VKYQEEQVGMGTGKPWNVRELQFLDEGLVQPHSKISLSTQQEKNEDPKMKHSNQSGIGACLEELVKEGDDEVKEVGTAKNVDQKLLVEFKHLPDQNVEFLGEEDLLYRARKVCLGESTR
jgi:hypothetical protein